MEMVCDFAAALEELVEFYQTRDRASVCYYDISVSECRALAVISRRGPMRLRSVADALKLDKSTTSRIVSSLLDKGYVKCRRDEVDTRGLRISATSAGRKIHDCVRLDLMSEYAVILGKYPASFRRQIAGFLREVTRAAKRRQEVQP